MQSNLVYSEQIGWVPILYQNVFCSDSHIYFEIEYLLFNSLIPVFREALSKSVGLHEHEKGIRSAVFQLKQQLRLNPTQKPAQENIYRS